MVYSSKLTAVEKLFSRSDILLKANAAEEYTYQIFIDSDHELWLYTKGQSPGVYYF
jgi:hypothetical protein